MTKREKAAFHSAEFFYGRIEFDKQMFEGGTSKACKLHSAFGTAGTRDHNCLGCNFENFIRFAANSYTAAEKANSADFAAYQWVLAMYLLVERVEFVLARLLSKDHNFQKQNFANLLLVKRWANFLKHPKAFMLTHHACIYFEGDPSITETILVDSNFVNLYYAKDDKKLNAELYDKVANQANVAVVFPNPLRVTQGFCTEFNQFLDLCASDPKIVEKLKEKATFVGYFSDEELLGAN
jgi:hypothetical protein